MNATGVTAGPAESNCKLLLGTWRDSLHVTCGLTACTPGSAPGPTLGNEYGKTLPFTVFLALEVARPVNQHCANCISTLSFPVENVNGEWSVKRWLQGRICDTVIAYVRSKADVSQLGLPHGTKNKNSKINKTPVVTTFCKLWYYTLRVHGEKEHIAFSPSFLLLKYLLRGFPGLFTVISQHMCFLLLVFFPFLHFLVVGSVR